MCYWFLPIYKLLFKNKTYNRTSGLYFKRKRCLPSVRQNVPSKTTAISYQTSIQSTKISSQIQLHTTINQYIYKTSNTRGSKPTRTSNSRIQIINFNHFRSHNLLNNQLRNPITNFHFKLNIRMIKQYHPNRSPIVRINNTRTNVNRVLPRQTRPRSYKPKKININQNPKNTLNKP
ncbi:hypothetical protein Hanom_Chr05g00447471 [Helianthus anomalus]